MIKTFGSNASAVQCSVAQLGASDDKSGLTGLTQDTASLLGGATSDVSSHASNISRVE